MKRKKTNKKVKKLWGLEPKTFSKSTRYFLEGDTEFIKKLAKDDPKAAEWLSNFNQEYYGNTIKKRGSLHKGGKKVRRQLWNENNKRRSDVYNKFIKFDINDLTNYESDEIEAWFIEDKMIEAIDLKTAIDKKTKKE